LYLKTRMPAKPVVAEPHSRCNKGLLTLADRKEVTWVLKPKNTDNLHYTVKKGIIFSVIL
jgi:hypothetical protein